LRRKSNPRKKKGTRRARPRATDHTLGHTSKRMAEILASAANMFYQKGYHATTIEDVARDVGILKGSLYYYIDSKEDLLFELLLDVIEQGDQRLKQAIEGIQDPAEQLQRAVDAQIEHIIQNQVRVGLFLHEFDNFHSGRWQRVRDVMRRYQRRFENILRAGQASGQFVEGDPWLLANGILGAGNFIYRWYPGHKAPSLEAVKKTFVPLILNGVTRR